MEKAIEHRIQLNNKQIYSSRYDYQKKMKKLTSTYGKLTDDEKKATEDQDFIKVRKNVTITFN